MLPLIVAQCASTTQNGAQEKPNERNEQIALTHPLVPTLNRHDVILKTNIISDQSSVLTVTGTRDM